MTALRLTHRAEADLSTIFTDMAHEFRFFGEDAVRRYCEGLKEELDRLARHPATGRAELALDPNVRSQPFRGHVIYYEPDEDGILVLRVLADG
jgi:toxin ParE1/3/4